MKEPSKQRLSFTKSIIQINPIRAILQNVTDTYEALRLLTASGACIDPNR